MAEAQKSQARKGSTETKQAKLYTVTALDSHVRGGKGACVCVYVTMLYLTMRCLEVVCVRVGQC